MITLNLLPDIKNDYLKAKRSRDRVVAWSVVVGGSFAGLVVVALLIVGIQWFIVDGTRNTIDDLSARLQNSEDITTVLTVQNQLQELPGLHENKPRATRLFSYLTTLTPNNTRLGAVEIDYENSQVEIRGTTETIRDLNILVDTFKAAQYRSGPLVDPEGDEEFESLATILEGDVSSIDPDTEFTSAFSRVVSSLSIQSGGDGVSFTLQFSYNTDLFDARYSVVELQIPDFVDRDSTPAEAIFEETEE